MLNLLNSILCTENHIMKLYKSIDSHDVRIEHLKL